MFRFFSRPSSGGPPLCFVPLLFFPLICVRWVCIITQYVAACLCHLCVFGVLVCWWSACAVKNVFVSIKPLYVSVFFHDHLQGVLRCALCRYCSSRWYAFVEFVLSRSLCHLCVFGVLVCWWSAWELSQADHQQTRTPNTHRRHTHAATYCVIIRNQRTQISGKSSNGTKHSGGPPEDGREKRPKHVGVLYLQTRF